VKLTTILPVVSEIGMRVELYLHRNTKTYSETKCHRQFLSALASLMCGEYTCMPVLTNSVSRFEAYPRLTIVSLEIVASVSGVG
jgi:hypothetical protein